jgi:alpha-amylase/alpha-mannosidase (GH57 family)
MARKLSIAFLWHMHQPLYKDFISGQYVLPWVRLHATCSYLDMISMMYEYPYIKVNFNLTPSLIWQLLDISENESVDDVFLNAAKKDASHLDADDKCFILKNFFSCYPERAIFPVEKYKELYFRRENDLRKERLLEKADQFTEQDFRDLQVFFNLAWCGFTLREKDPIVRELLEKGSGFTEDDKLSLLKRQREVVALLLPTYKKLQDEGRIEVSTSPYYHPILPLLCKGESGQGFDFIEDAKVQVKRAVDLYESVFDRKPKGMWPSEGAVSPEIIPILADQGIKWAATDEAILLESVKGARIPRGELIYKVYDAVQDGKELSMIFRDVNISNAISFNYSNMSAEDASMDLFNNKIRIKWAMEPKKGEHVAAIILDGENPWPYYPNYGKDFLSRMYELISSYRSVETVTIGEYMASHEKKRKIKKLASGSWINANFRKWIGSPQKNRAWELLKKAREDLLSLQDPPKEALEELYIAEGSDWFWWYDEFGCELNHIFDDLFRMHLANIYKLTGKQVPGDLTMPMFGMAPQEKEHRFRAEMA